MSPQITSFEFGALVARRLRLTLLDEALRIEQGKAYLEVPYDNIEEVVGYGWGGVLGLVIMMRPRRRLRCLHLYRPFPSKVADCFEALATRLDDYRVTEDMHASGISGLAILSLFTSWQREASCKKLV
jgi:pimeloyl-ACP methyl ester carboxylesterase